MQDKKPVTRLRVERARRGWSQTALAAKAGRLSGSDISRFERGYARPYPAQAERLAQVLGLHLDELLEPADGT
jgi:transcriptional regulator with XRE-family HTH domain